MNDGRARVGLPTFGKRLSGSRSSTALTLREASVLARHANPRVTAQVYADLSEKTRERVEEKLTESGFGA